MMGSSSCQILYIVLNYTQKKLPDKVGLRVNEIILGGSLGTRTELPGRYDAEIIIYSPGKVIHS